MPVQRDDHARDRVLVDVGADERHLALQLGELATAASRAARGLAARPRPGLGGLAGDLRARLDDRDHRRRLGCPARVEIAAARACAAAISWSSASIVARVDRRRRRRMSRAERVALALERGDAATRRPRARAGFCCGATFTRAARGVEQVDGLVGELAAGDVAAERRTAAVDRLVADDDAVGLLVAVRAGRGASVMATSSLGSSTLTGWKRRSSAASFSKYFLYSVQVVAAMVRSSPRASAGLSRLAASPPPAAPPAPMSVWASSMKRMIGFGEPFTSSMTSFSRFSNSPFTLAPAWSEAEVEARGARRPAARSGTSPVDDRQREALDERGLADARLADDDRVVLPAPREDVDHLPDLALAAEDRVDLALARLVGERRGEARERLAAGGACPASARREGCS